LLLELPVEAGGSREAVAAVSGADAMTGMRVLRNISVR
jgi:hypothetical protein